MKAKDDAVAGPMNGDGAREGSAGARRLRHAAEGLTSALRNCNQDLPEAFPGAVIGEIAANLASVEELESGAGDQALAHARDRLREARQIVVNGSDDPDAADSMIVRALNAALIEIGDRLDSLPEQERLALQPRSVEPQLLAPREVQERQILALEQRIERLEGGVHRTHVELNLVKTGDIRVDVGQLKIQLDALVRNSVELKAELLGKFINLEWVGELSDAVRHASQVLGATADLLRRTAQDLTALLDAVGRVRRLGHRVADGGRTLIRFVHRLLKRQMEEAEPPSLPPEPKSDDGPWDVSEIVEMLALDETDDATRGSGRHGEPWRLPLSHEARATLGDRLAELGDPRRGVGLRDGLPDIDWCRVEGGTVAIASNTPATRQVQPFWMARYPVTITQFQAFVRDCYRDGRWEPPAGFSSDRLEGPPQHRGRHDNHPADSVSWYDAAAFCHWLSARLGTEIRLPTEFEWQLAATGGNPGSNYPWGRQWDPREQPWRANTKESGLRRSTTVGLYPRGASTTGLLDMAGTIWEWCANVQDDPNDTGRSEGNLRVLRGGSWFNSRGYARCAYRGRAVPFSRYDNVGFRVVCSSPITSSGL